MDDVPALAVLAERFRAEGPYASTVVGSDPQLLENLTLGVMHAGRIFLAETEDGDTAIGFLGAVVVPHPLTGEFLTRRGYVAIEVAHLKTLGG